MENEEKRTEPTDQQKYWQKIWDGVMPISVTSNGVSFTLGQNGVKDIFVGDDTRGATAATVVNTEDKVMATVFGSFIVTYK